MENRLYIIKHEEYDDLDTWEVKGGRWLGNVKRLKTKGKFDCDCYQFHKYGSCIHVRAVKKYYLKINGFDF
ncbi:MAG: hypothetical protein WC489_05000 [Patescibacteria group bacterium]